MLFEIDGAIRAATARALTVGENFRRLEQVRGEQIAFSGGATGCGSLQNRLARGVTEDRMHSAGVRLAERSSAQEREPHAWDGAKKSRLRGARVPGRDRERRS